MAMQHGFARRPKMLHKRKGRNQGEQRLLGGGAETDMHMLMCLAICTNDDARPGKDHGLI